MRICVFGLWHLGTVTAACLADGGHTVIGLDPDAKVVVNLCEASREGPWVEPQQRRRTMLGGPSRHSCRPVHPHPYRRRRGCSTGDQIFDSDPVHRDRSCRVVQAPRRHALSLEVEWVGGIEQRGGSREYRIQEIWFSIGDMRAGLVHRRSTRTHPAADSLPDRRGRVGSGRRRNSVAR